MSFEMWQLPVLVMAGIVIVEFFGRIVLRRWRTTIPSSYVRIAVNAAIWIGLAAFFVAAFFAKDASMTDRIIAILSAILNVVSTYYTYQSFIQAKRTSQSIERISLDEAEDPPLDGPTHVL